MSAENLKKNYGGTVIFNGGIDSVNKLIYGTKQDCIDTTREVLGFMYVSTFASLLCLGLRASSGLPWAVCILLATLSGTLVGLVNGILVTKFKIHSFIATLGMSKLIGMRVRNHCTNAIGEIISVQDGVITIDYHDGAV